jgi:glycosyltransferase involved in cell wall biosynthesis
MRQIIYGWNYREWGGAQIYFMSLMKAAKDEYAVLVVLPRNSDQKLLDYLSAIHVKVEFLPPAPVLASGKGLIAGLRRKWTLYTSERRAVRQILSRTHLSETIVHVDLGFWQSFAALAQLSLRTNVFTTVHTALAAVSGLRRLRWQIKGKLISRFSGFHLLASNGDARQSLRPYVSEDVYRRIEVIYSGFDPDELGRVADKQHSKQDVRSRYELDNSRVLLMAVGQFIIRKGCWVLLDALKQLLAAQPEFTFVWVSTTTPSVEMMGRVEEYGLSEFFRIISAEEVGPTRDDLLTLLWSADIFVLPSFQEGLPVALVEAMALGLPCIASDINAIPEAIEHDINGILVPPGDAAQLEHAINELVQDPDRRTVLGAAARATAYARFNERHITGRMMELYKAAWKTPL